MRKSLPILFAFLFAAVSATAGVWFTDLRNALSPRHVIEFTDERGAPVELTFDPIDRFDGTFTATLHWINTTSRVTVNGKFESIKDLDFDGPLVNGRRAPRTRQLHFRTTFQTMAGSGWGPVVRAYHIDLYMKPDTRGPVRGEGYCLTSQGLRRGFTVVYR